MDCVSGTTTAVGGGAAAASAVGSSSISCRWNPTKEQIDMLENFYAQGLRTPTAEQIQEMTARLQTYGHIEGKNVFYWFQNHKARQRQKEKQDHIAFFRQYNRHHHHHLLHRPQPAAFVHLPPRQNVMYEQACYMPQNNNLGFYAQYPQVLSPTASSSNSSGGGIKRRRTPKPRSNIVSGFMSSSIDQPESGSNNHAAGGSNIDDHQAGEVKVVIGRKNLYSHHRHHHHEETLDLFPVHPTGILQERVEATGNAS